MINPIEQRLQTLREQFPKWEVEAILIESATNRRWLSGFTGSAGRLLISSEQTILATDSRYWLQAGLEAPEFSLFPDNRRHEDTILLIESANARKIGLEANHVTLTGAEKLRSIAGITWTPLQNAVEPLREVKSLDEVKLIRAAAAITDKAMAMVPELVYPGISECALAWELEKKMRENGAEGLAFPIIVAFGPNSALPHYRPGDRKLQTGDIVLVDMGAKVDGYRSDLTRTFLYANQLNQQFSTIYNLVLSAHENAANNIQPGVNTQEAHSFAMGIIAAGGHEEDFSHGLGHGVGLDIHEEPHLSQLRPAAKIMEGMIITVEPGIYLPGWGGVRVEDLYLVTKTGVEAISQCPKVIQICK